jgi:PAS domain S-box-containing protein
MTELSGSGLESLRERGEFTLYRGRQRGYPCPVLVVALAAGQPSPQSLKRLEHEYSLSAQLEPAWAARPLALTRQEGRTMLVLEDPGGEPLDRVLDRGQGRALELTRFLRVAIGLATALGQVHRHGLVHKDIKPANVLVNLAGGVWLTGFGIASRIPRERQSPEPPEFIAGTLAYMAPEQTGRMNRSMDSRSDLYSLGVTLYEMLTGTLPFTASDPMEWVHCHIARRPVPPAERLKDIPAPVSAIIMKLLAKTAEERYQTAAGLESDLRRCLAQWEAERRIDDFPLGEHDTPDRLLISEKLYGREREIETLLASFDRVVTSGNAELVLVSGYSGIGKSSVVNELHKMLVPPRGLFASGKFDQYKRDIPYATLAQAFQSIVRSILGQSDTELARWRDALREALGPNGQLIVNLVPELELVLGAQPPVAELAPQDAKSRFQTLFRRFVDVFARPEHPLALFLDDLQWLDAATLELLEHLLAHSDVRHLLLVGAYRDNEVGAAHPLVRTLEAIRTAGARVHEILLAPLGLDDVARLISDALRCKPERALPLAQLVHAKTGGNPFFAIQFFTALADDGLLASDPAQPGWQWDMNRIRARSYTDNVVELMAGKLKRLSAPTQEALKRLACLGNTAEIATLTLVHGATAEAMHAELWEAVHDGLVFRLENDYKFLHDRIQQAAYTLIPEAQRAGVHLRIGRVLLASKTADGLAEHVFEIVNQLNRGAALITARDERERLAELNLIAGKRAKASTAYASALTYLVAGAALLAEDSWERRHELSFALELNRAECEFLTGALAQAGERLTALSVRAATAVERASVACLRIDLDVTLDQSARAVAAGLDYLRHLGIEWMPHPTAEDARREYQQVWSTLGDRPIEALLELPLMSDPTSLATLDVLTRLTAPAWYTDANLLSLVICRAVNLSVEGGNCDASCFAYATLGLLAGPRFDDYKAGFRFGRLGYDLVEQRGLKRFQARTYMNFGNVVLPWTKHVREGRDLVRRAFEAANQVGDLVFAAFCCHHVNTNLLAAGDPLDEVEAEAEFGLAFAQKMRFGLGVDFVAVQLALVRTLRGSTPRFGCFDDGEFDELGIERRFSENPNLAIAECWYWIRKLQARFFAGDYAAALESSEKAQPLLWTSPSLFDTAEYHFYGALSRAASCDCAAPGQRLQQVEALRAHHRQLEIWAANCPENFENRAALVGAEIARIEGRALDAMDLYEQAIRSARANGFVHNEAVANELAGRFYLERGLEKNGHAHLRDARAGYSLWGADGKTKQLDRIYPHLAAPERHRPAATNGSPVQQLDVASVVKASHAISGEIVLEDLVDTLMRIVLENAGAQTGHLILVRDERLVLTAEAGVEQQKIQVRLHRGEAPPESAFPASIINYVRRSQQRVLLADATQSNPFSTDDYFARRQPKSVLCLPIMRRSTLIGLLYLENNLATHAFTSERLTVLELLASQAAISLENALLYSDVREREGRIRRLVESNVIGVHFWELSGGLTEANDAFLRTVGYSREDLLSGNVNWTSMTPPEYRAADAHAVEELARSGTFQPYEKEYIRKDGERVAVLLAGATFEGSSEQGVAFILDLTERKQADAERGARQAAEMANEAKSEFLARMSHELRTPLTGILGYAEILRGDRTLTERQSHYVGVMRQSGEHLLTLINDILDFARIEAGKLDLSVTEIPMANFLSVIADIIRVRAEEKQLAFRCDIAPDLPLGVLADERRLRQVLLNLLANAVKFTDRGEVSLRVTFAPPSRLRFEVRDTGIGVGEDRREAIFQPFEQAGDRRHRVGGTGLGLAISRQLVRLMGSDIGIESRLGEGSAFWFELDLPVVQAHAAAAIYESVVTSYEGPRRTILAVDDVAANRMLLGDMLSPLGFEVAEAASGREGLEKAQSLRPDLILMDSVMPEMDGLEATRRLRRLPGLGEIPVIAISADASGGNEAIALAAGANAFLPKPFDLGALVAQVGDLLQLQWTREPRASGPAPRGDRQLVALPAQELAVLHRLALLGNMRDISREAAHLSELDGRYGAFADELKVLAKGYQSKAILRLVEQHMDPHAE